MNNKQIQIDLANAYQLFAKLGMDDTVYTHLSARSADRQSYFIQPFGVFFEEVKHNELMEVDFNGKIISDHDEQYNKTGYFIHSAIYKSRPDINAIFHLHTQNGVAVSAEKCGLLPISQFSLLFYDRIDSFKYDSLVLNHEQTNGYDPDNKNILLENHGTISMGSTIQEAFFYAYYLEQACAVQCKIKSPRNELIQPSHEICQKARHDMHNFEDNLGEKMWNGFIRKFLR